MKAIYAVLESFSSTQFGGSYGNLFLDRIQEAI